MNRVQIWTAAARPKTLIASLSPVLIGTTLALAHGSFDLQIFLFTLATALGIQVGTNLANDYFDFIKGADTSERKGPQRLTESGLVSAQSVKRAMIITFVLTFLAGCYLIWHGGIAIALLLSVSILLGVIYTGGPYPLAYLGLGDLFVFVFFGPVAVAGTYYLQTDTVSIEALLAGIAPGALSTAILIVNNIRDIEEDRKASKKTLPVRLGKTFGQLEYLFVLLITPVPLLLFYNSHPFSLLGFLVLLPAIPLLREIFHPPHSLNATFVKTGKLLWIYTLAFCIGWML